MEKEKTAAAKKIQNAYVKAWRKRNPEKVRDINIRYWNKKAREVENDPKDERN